MKYLVWVSLLLIFGLFTFGKNVNADSFSLRNEDTSRIIIFDPDDSLYRSVLVDSIKDSTIYGHADIVGNYTFSDNNIKFLYKLNEQYFNVYFGKKRGKTNRTTIIRTGFASDIQGDHNVIDSIIFYVNTDTLIVNTENIKHSDILPYEGSFDSLKIYHRYGSSMIRKYNTNKFDSISVFDDRDENVRYVNHVKPRKKYREYNIVSIEPISPCLFYKRGYYYFDGEGYVVHPRRIGISNLFETESNRIYLSDSVLVYFDIENYNVVLHQ